MTTAWHLLVRRGEGDRGRRRSSRRCTESSRGGRECDLDRLGGDLEEEDEEYSESRGGEAGGGQNLPAVPV